MTLISRILSVSLLSWAMVFMPLWAHDAWADRVILIHFGEPGEALDAYQPDQIRDLSAITADGQPLAVSGKPVGEQAIVVDSPTGEPAAVFFTMALPHYIITADDWKKASKEDALKAAKSWTGSYTVTSIFAWQPSLAQSRNRHVELVPLVDPLSVRPGGKLALRAYRDGKPVAGLTVGGHEDNSPKYVSDTEGNLAVPLTTGRQIILGSIDEVDGGHTVGHLAVLSFTLR